MNEEHEIIRQRAQIRIGASVIEIGLTGTQQCIECREVAPTRLDVVDHLVTCPVQLAEDVMYLLGHDGSVSQWRIFDKDDESTWPSEIRVEYWISGQSILNDEWFVVREWWAGSLAGTDWIYASHWLPIEIPPPPPAPPSKGEEG